MRDNQFHVGGTFERVGQFVDAHPDIAAAVNPTVGREQLNAAITALQDAATEQGAAKRDRHGEAQYRATLEDTLLSRYMTPIGKFARAQLRGVPNFAALTPATSHLPGPALVNAARGMAKAAAPFTSRMEGANFKPGFLQELAQATEAVHQALLTTANGNRRRTGATQSVQMALQTGRAAVQAIDSIVTHLIHGNASLEAEWRSAKRITKSTRSGKYAGVPVVPPVVPPIVPPVVPPVVPPPMLISAAPFGVPNPVGPSYPAFDVHRYDPPRMTRARA